MKILHLTDTEGRLPVYNNLPLPDIIIITGDIGIGSKSIRRFTDYLKRLRDIFPNRIPIFFIPGNREYETFFTDDSVELPRNMYPIHGKCVLYRGDDGLTVRLIGFGGALPGFNNNLVYDEDIFYNRLKRLFSSSPDIILGKNDNVNSFITILCVHTPPKSTGLDRTHAGDHIGSYAVLKIIREESPELCLCGHVHESAGVEVIGKTICINPGASKFGNGCILEITDTDPLFIKYDFIKFESTQK